MSRQFDYVRNLEEIHSRLSADPSGNDSAPSRVPSSPSPGFHLSPAFTPGHVPPEMEAYFAKMSPGMPAFSPGPAPASPAPPSARPAGPHSPVPNTSGGFYPQMPPYTLLPNFPVFPASSSDPFRGPNAMPTAASPVSVATRLPSEDSRNTEKPRRSRYGCFTCRKRKKRCSETKPVCEACQRLGLPCEWPAPGQEHRNRNRKRKADAEDAAESADGTDAAETAEISEENENVQKVTTEPPPKRKPTKGQQAGEQKLDIVVSTESLGKPGQNSKSGKFGKLGKSTEEVETSEEIASRRISDPIVPVKPQSPVMSIPALLDGGGERMRPNLSESAVGSGAAHSAELLDDGGGAAGMRRSATVDAVQLFDSAIAADLPDFLPFGEEENEEYTKLMSLLFHSGAPGSDLFDPHPKIEPLEASDEETAAAASEDALLGELLGSSPEDSEKALGTLRSFGVGTNFNVSRFVQFLRSRIDRRRPASATHDPPQPGFYSPKNTNYYHLYANVGNTFSLPLDHNLAFLLDYYKNKLVGDISVTPAGKNTFIDTVFPMAADNPMVLYSVLSISSHWAGPKYRAASRAYSDEALRLVQQNLSSQHMSYVSLTTILLLITRCVLRGDITGWYSILQMASGVIRNMRASESDLAEMMKSTSARWLLRLYAYVELTSTAAISNGLTFTSDFYQRIFNDQSGDLDPFYGCSMPLFALLAKAFEITAAAKKPGTVSEVHSDASSDQGDGETAMQMKELLEKAKLVEMEIAACIPHPSVYKYSRDEMELQLTLFETFQYTLRLYIRHNLYRMVPSSLEMRVLVDEFLKLLDVILGKRTESASIFPCFIAGVCCMPSERPGIRERLENLQVRYPAENIDSTLRLLEMIWRGNPDGDRWVDFYEIVHQSNPQAGYILSFG